MAARVNNSKPHYLDSLLSSRNIQANCNAIFEISVHSYLGVESQVISTDPHTSLIFDFTKPNHLNISSKYKSAHHPFGTSQTHTHQTMDIYAIIPPIHHPSARPNSQPTTTQPIASSVASARTGTKCGASWSNGDDAAWARRLEALGRYARESSGFYNGLDLLEKFELEEGDDKGALDSARTAAVRAHFKAWATAPTVKSEQGGMERQGLSQRYRYCVRMGDEGDGGAGEDGNEEGGYDEVNDFVDLIWRG